MTIEATLDLVIIINNFKTKEGKKYIKSKAKEFGVKTSWYLTEKTTRRINGIFGKYY